MPLSICESDRRRAKDMGEDRREEIQAYDMARQFYQRAVKLKPDSPVLQEFEARQDSINQLNN